MKKSMNKSTSAAVGISTVFLLGLGAASLAPSYGAPGDDDAVAPQSVVAAAAKPRACDGGAYKRLHTRTQADPFSFVGTSNSLVAVPGAQVTLTGPSKGLDTLLVTFSAETFYQGSGWLTLEVRDNNVPIQPFAANGSPFAFASEASYQGSSAQFCTKVGKGTHRITVRVGTTGGASESGWLDDWTLSVLRCE